MGALAWLHRIIMNHKIGIILRLVTTNHISIIGISIVTNVKYFLILHFKDSFMISSLHLPFFIVYFFLNDWGA